MMLRNHKAEVIIDEQDPFKNDAVGLGKYASILTKIVNLYNETGCVLALNGEWGSGKTTFVRMWKRQLEIGGWTTLYLNAWDSDYTNAPLMALVEELKNVKGEENLNYRKITAIAGKLLLAFATGLLKTAIGYDPINDVTKTINEIGQEQLNEYRSQQNTFVEFKKELENFVSKITEEHPLVFFIDELDRCSPSYAVKTLEIVKHLFEIPHIVFVLSVNKSQLENAIRGYFNSPEMDAAEYLHRFIDINYNLPKTGFERYCKSLFEQYDFKTFLGFVEQSEKAQELINVATLFAKIYNMNLRSLDKVFALCRLVTLEYSSNTECDIQLFYTLCLWRVIKPTLYNVINLQTLDVDELIQNIKDNIPRKYLEIPNEQYGNLTDMHRHLIFIIADLITRYDNFDGHANSNRFKVQQKQEQKTDYGIVSQIIDVKLLNEAITSYLRKDSVGNHPIKPIISKINLMTELQGH